MNKFFRILLCAALIFSLSAGAVFAAPETSVADRIITDILTAKAGGADPAAVQAWIDGPLSDDAGECEWYILALAQSGEVYDFSSYTEALSAYLAEKTVKNAVTAQKYALSFWAAGVKNDFTAETAADSIGQLGIMSVIFGLHLLENGIASDERTADSVLEMLLSRATADGGFSLTGAYADVDVTAMAVQALAHFSTDEEAQTAMARAIDCLAALRREDGHYETYGNSNAESVAQVITALTAAGVDIFTDARFTENGKTLLDTMMEFRLEDGTFSHVKGGDTDENATAQALLAAISLKRQSEGKTPLFDLDRADTAVYVSSEDAPAETKMTARGIILITLVAAALIVCAILFAVGKRHPKNFLAVGIVLALAVLAVLFIKVERSEDYYGGTVAKGEIVGEVTLSIRCDAVAGKADHIPADGVILPSTVFAIDADDTVYDILLEAAKAHGIPLDKEGAEGFYYIAGMAYLYEFDFGDLSGWTFAVNGEKSSVGCDVKTLSDGDVIAWTYTLTQGK